eukprot:7185644-Pyramimonas_sp.AAC.1
MRRSIGAMGNREANPRERYASQRLLPHHTTGRPPPRHGDTSLLVCRGGRSLISGELMQHSR